MGEGQDGDVPCHCAALIERAADAVIADRYFAVLDDHGSYLVAARKLLQLRPPFGVVAEVNLLVHLAFLVKFHLDGDTDGALWMRVDEYAAFSQS